MASERLRHQANLPLMWEVQVSPEDTGGLTGRPWPGARGLCLGHWMDSSPMTVVLQLIPDPPNKGPEICFGFLKAAGSPLFQKWQEHSPSSLEKSKSSFPRARCQRPARASSTCGIHWSGQGWWGHSGRLCTPQTPACLAFRTFRISPGRESRTEALTHGVAIGLDSRTEVLPGPKP